MSDNQINIEIDGKKIAAKAGATIIETADAHSIYIPRFCYHKKLTVAANCRMCLIEIDGSKKAVPACATPITAGMKIRTRSKLTRAAQKAVMEFLLINHPLDCPICDQGGQCELQDLAVGYGKNDSRYFDRKRVVKDKHVGPLISTCMTRCILCTRCVRFGEEIAGVPELGTIGRGEHTEIGTYIERAVQSELSGNMIDVCPVGALTSKPFRFTARAWELQQRPSIAAHDCLGSNINVHVLHNRVMRVVPNENEAINEVWLSDRDRFSYVGLNNAERLRKPLLKQKDGTWQEVDWTSALEVVAGQLQTTQQQHGSEQLAALISPNATLEEHYLLQKIWRALGSNNIDHRLRQTDFRDQASMPAFPQLGMAIADLATLDACLLIGSDIQREQPLAAMRLFKASSNDAVMMTINPYDYSFSFTTMVNLVKAPAAMVQQLAAVVKALAKGKSLPSAAEQLLTTVKMDENACAIAANLLQGERKAIIIGALAQNSEVASQLRYLARLIAELSEATFGELTYGANAAGAWLSGCVPHRCCTNANVSTPGMDAQAMFAAPRKSYLLFNLEPEFDCANPTQALHALKRADFVVACSPFVSDTMRNYADVILPIVPFSEMAGTLINCNGTWQRFTATVMPLVDARPGWKVLRVLANFLDLADFTYTDSQEVNDEIKQVTAEHQPLGYVPSELSAERSLTRVSHWLLYRGDNLVRRSEPLQAMLADRVLAVQINANTAAKLGISEGEQVHVGQGEVTAELPVNIDDCVADDCILLAAGTLASAKFGPAFGAVEIRKKD